MTDGLLLNAQQGSLHGSDGADSRHLTSITHCAARPMRPRSWPCARARLDLTDIDVTIVTVAALLLHDIGYHRSARDHHRKTWDDVLRMRLDGLTWEEQRLAAFGHTSTAPTAQAWTRRI